MFMLKLGGTLMVTLYLMSALIFKSFTRDDLMTIKYGLKDNYPYIRICLNLLCWLGFVAGFICVVIGVWQL